MHIYAVGKSGETGSKVNSMLTRKYNKERKALTGNATETKTIDAAINVDIVTAKIALESNASLKIRRPQMIVYGKVTDLWGDITEDIDHVSFLPESLPDVTYVYTLNDDEIKSLIDAGLYRNQRFEEVLKKLAESQTFEVETKADLKVLNLHTDKNRVESIVVVEDMPMIEHDRTKEIMDGPNDSFLKVIDVITDMSLMLESQGLEASAILGDEEEVDVDREEFVDVDKPFNIDKIQMAAESDESDEKEVIIDEDITDVTTRFGQTTEDSEIERMKKERTYGPMIDTDLEDAFESNNETNTQDDEVEPLNIFDEDDDDVYEEQVIIERNVNQMKHQEYEGDPRDVVEFEKDTESYDSADMDLE